MTAVSPTGATSATGACQELRQELRPGRGIALLLAAIVLFCLMDALAKHLSKTYPVMQVVWARYVFHIVLLVPLLFRTDPLRLFRTQRLGLQLSRSLTLFGSTSLFYLAISLMPLADASSISAVTPLIVTALSVPFLGEKVGPRRWAAVCIGFIGVLIIIRPGPNVINEWAYLPLLNSLCFAFYSLTTRSLSRTDGATTTLFYSASIGAVLISLAAPTFWQSPDFMGWVMLATVGLVGGASHFLLIRAYDHAPASVLAPFSYVQLIWMAVLGYVFFGDLPDSWTITGALVVAGSGLYVFYREAVRRREAQGG